MNLYIVDDEFPARLRMRTLIRELDDKSLLILGEADRGDVALAEIERLKPDVVLLDIAMPVMDGLEVARHLAELELPPAVIFVTAYDEFALAAFEAKAIDYVLKPVRTDRLRQALDKARRFSPERARDLRLAMGKPRSRSHLCARVRGNLKLVPVQDVVYLQADDKYVAVHSEHGEILLDESLKSLETEFEGVFVRLHRNCLVAADRLIAIEKDPKGDYIARVRGVDKPFEISRRCLASVRAVARQL
ncbi:MAG: response regulator transcription factor [Ahniella sp.]|nr:response regulator transcription factor [Ahniella sp.]